MRYGILGPIEVRDGERDVPLAQGRQRLLLALLLLHANETVSTDRLIDALWGASPPATVTASLQNLVSALRKSLGSGAVLTNGHGYTLKVGEDELDAQRFAALAARGRAALGDSDASGASKLLGEALALWRGPPLAELAYEAAIRDPAARLEELRLEAIEDRIDADLALGRHAELLVELAGLAAAHPTRERIRGQQMLALYRSGRQAEALEAYRDARRQLVDELGIEPGPALQRLERAILAQDPELGPPDALPPAPPGRRRRRRRVLVAAGVVVLAVVVFVAVRHDGGQPAAALGSVQGDSVAEIDPVTKQIVAEYPVGGTPTVVTGSAGAVWTINADGQTISRIDRAAKRVRTFATGSVPLDAAASETALWVVTGHPGAGGKPPPAALARLDPHSGVQESSTVLRPTRGQAFLIPPQLVAADGRAAWGIGRTRRVTRVDLRTGATTVLRAPAVVQVAIGAGQVWALGDGPESARLYRLDPRSGAILAHVDVPASEPGLMTVARDAVWITDAAAGELWRIDTGGRPVQRTVPVDEGVDGVAAGAGAIWASNSLSGTVARIDPRTNRVTDRIAVGNTPRSVTVAGGRVWVAVAGGGRPAVPPAGSLRADSPVTPLRTSSCGPALTGASGAADVLLVSELPLQGASQPTTRSMAAAIAFVLREHRFRAGRFRLALQTCDDSTAQSAEPFDSGKCQANAKAEAADRSVVGVIGPMHSGCSAEMLPLLNGAAGGPVAVLSHTNTAKFLVRRDPGDPAGLLAHLHPAGRQGYARIMPTEDYETAAVAMMAQRLGGPVFYLEDSFTDHGSYERWFRYAAQRLGLGVKGSAVWDPAARHYRRLAERVRASGAGTVVLFGSLVVNGGQVVRDLRAALGPRVRILAYSGFTPLSELFADAGPAARGVYVSAGGPQLDRRSAAGQRFLRAFGATRPGGRVTSFDAYAAAATEAMLDAVARSDGTRASISRLLTATRLRDSPIGPVSFDRRGEPSEARIAIARAEQRPGGSVPLVYSDVSGGRIVAVLTVPRRLIDPAR